MSRLLRHDVVPPAPALPTLPMTGNRPGPEGGTRAGAYAAARPRLVPLGPRPALNPGKNGTRHPAPATRLWQSGSWPPTGVQGKQVDGVCEQVGGGLVACSAQGQDGARVAGRARTTRPRMLEQTSDNGRWPNARKVAPPGAATPGSTAPPLQPAKMPALPAASSRLPCPDLALPFPLRMSPNQA